MTGRGWKAVAAVIALCSLSGCWLWSDPKGTPATPAPITVSPTPVEAAQLVHRAERCGTDAALPNGDGSFAGKITWPARSRLPNHMTVELGVYVSLASSHGKHSVDLQWTDGYVVDESGTVTGLVVAFSTPGQGGSSGTALSAPVWVTLGTCADEDGGVALGDPLPDGAYQLVMSGMIHPVDHEHAVGEYWVASPLDFGVADGLIKIPTPA